MENGCPKHCAEDRARREREVEELKAFRLAFSPEHSDDGEDIPFPQAIRASLKRATAGIEEINARGRRQTFVMVGLVVACALTWLPASAVSAVLKAEQSLVKLL